MQAPKNGFFYVIDRTNGQFISGSAYTQVNWATGLDENGRAPVKILTNKVIRGIDIY